MKIILLILCFTLFSGPHFLCSCDHIDGNSAVELAWSGPSHDHHSQNSQNPTTTKNSTCAHGAHCFAKATLIHAPTLSPLMATSISVVPAIGIKNLFSEAHLRPVFQPPAFLNA